jgi:hypothetical protein
LFQRLLTPDFLGRDAIASQLSSASVMTIDNYGSLEISSAGPKANVSRRIPTEAEGRDEDGVSMFVLLHVIDGQAVELEIYKADGTPIRRMPEPSALDVTAGQ